MIFAPIQIHQHSAASEAAAKTFDEIAEAFFSMARRIMLRDGYSTEPTAILLRLLRNATASVAPLCLRFGIFIPLV